MFQNQEGLKNRAIGTHNMNDHSSRSHTILTVHIHSEEKASSEDNNVSCNESERLIWPLYCRECTSPGMVRSTSWTLPGARWPRRPRAKARRWRRPTTSTRASWSWATASPSSALRKKQTKVPIIVPFPLNNYLHLLCLQVFTFPTETANWPSFWQTAWQGMESPSWWADNNWFLSHINMMKTCSKPCLLPPPYVVENFFCTLLNSFPYLFVSPIIFNELVQSHKQNSLLKV